MPSNLNFRLLCIVFMGIFILNVGHAHEERTKICLCMVVKDDEKSIERCLNSVKGIIDYASFCDVGSTDGTVQIIEDFLSDNGIEGKVHTHKWRNFSHNHTLAINSAQKTLKESGFNLTNTYLLILEPDMILNASADFQKNHVNKDAYSLIEHSGLLSYSHYKPHLLKASLPWENNGIVSDSWSCNSKYQLEKIQTLSIDEIPDNTSRIGKLNQNIEVLQQTLKESPDDPQTLFYLAQSHKNLKNFEEAIRWYQARLKKEGKEEIWFSTYMLGECYEELQQWDKALFWYLEAHQYDPDRPDPIKKVASHYRNHGQNDLAYLFANYGSRIPYPKYQNLFNFPPLHDYDFDEELSIAAYYTRFRNEGYEAANEIILKKNVPWHVKDQAYRNLLFYVEKLKNARYEEIAIDLPLIQKGYDERYHPMNPSIQKTEDGYKVICRTVNYTQKDAKEFNTIDETGVFRTRNFLINYDRNFNKISQNEIIENLPRRRFTPFNLEGLDDCRIFEFDDNLWFTCTTGDTSSYNTFDISLCKLANEPSDKNTVNVEKLIPLQGPDPHRCEKNWVPFIKDNQLHVVYSYDPFIIYKPNPETGECETALYYEPVHDFTRFRGSAAPIEFDDGYLMIIHEVVQLQNYARRYLHRFVYMDKNFIIKQASKPFIFKQLGIEFCCSMSIDHTGKQLVIPIGIEDTEAWLCFVDFDTVRSLLMPLPSNIGNPF